MVLYAADLVDFEKPKPISTEGKESKEEVVKKEKKPLSEKQKAALLKGQETRRLKKEQAAKEKADMEELEKKLSEAAPKRKKPKAKPVEPKAEPAETKEEPKEEIVVATEIKEEPKKRKRSDTPKAPRKKTSEPPEWFKKYVEGVQKEKTSGGAEVSKKQENIIKHEALKVAQKSWDSGYTRDRVQNEVDQHSIQLFKLVNRMYSMIFSR